MLGNGFLVPYLSATYAVDKPDQLVHYHHRWLSRTVYRCVSPFISPIYYFVTFPSLHRLLDSKGFVDVDQHVDLAPFGEQLRESSTVRPAPLGGREAQPVLQLLPVWRGQSALCGPAVRPNLTGQNFLVLGIRLLLHTLTGAPNHYH